ncbi:MAG TPA: 2-amino-4-hydroxy-6-hydroxymethyldihydropteridine diphosphokinase [Allosphingosinicella sp.]|jgi:2-amino-4-hydroxy-6-hydroxymethyldihydropteridine diphosphokinase
MGKTSYALALGSNRRSRRGAPAETVRAALEALGADAASRIRTTPALGPAGRSFANAAALVTTDLDPPELLEALKAIERDFGRRPGRRWGPRVLDLDILLWSGGAWGTDGLVVPHAEMRRRRFVLEPLAEIAPGWRDPVSGFTVRQLLFRLKARRARRRPSDQSELL